MSLLSYRVYQIRVTGPEPPTLETLIAAFILPTMAQSFIDSRYPLDDITYEIREEDDAA